MAGLDARLIPVPFVAWHALAWMAEALPNPALTRNQIELMEVDTVASPLAFGLGTLGIEPRGIEQTAEAIAGHMPASANR